MLEAARKLDPRPFVALLLASLPNPSTLYIRIPTGSGGGPSSSGTCFERQPTAAASRMHAARRRPLKRLRSAYIPSGWDDSGYSNSNSSDERHKHYFPLHGCM